MNIITQYGVFKFAENKYKTGNKKPFTGHCSFIPAFAESDHFVPDDSKICFSAIITAPDDKFVDISFLRRKESELEGMFIVLKLCDSINVLKFVVTAHSDDFTVVWPFLL